MTIVHKQHRGEGVPSVSRPRSKSFLHLSTQGKGKQISEFGASPAYKMSSRTARATKRNPVSKKKKKKKERKQRMTR